MCAAIGTGETGDISQFRTHHSGHRHAGQSRSLVRGAGASGFRSQCGGDNFARLDHGVDVPVPADRGGHPQSLCQIWCSDSGHRGRGLSQRTGHLRRSPGRAACHQQPQWQAARPPQRHTAGRLGQPGDEPGDRAHRQARPGLATGGSMRLRNLGGGRCLATVAPAAPGQHGDPLLLRRDPSRGAGKGSRTAARRASGRTGGGAREGEQQHEEEQEEAAPSHAVAQEALLRPLARNS
mmetsp:Transcript_74765/g.226523  ORF Transcript_74765/g.226523 Transcript_74765/m.226523 type:complete len:237 (-) Transcript_74765:165-875(-)